MPPAHLAFIALIDLIWAFNIVAIKYAVDVVPPLTAVFIRYAIVLLVCLPWLKWLPGRMGTILVTGVIGGALFFGLGSYSFAIADNVSALAIAGQLGVPFSLILAVIFLKERIRWPRILGVTLAFLGVVILGFDPAIVHERLGLVLTVVASFLWAVSSLLMRQMKGVSPLTIHAWLALVSLPLLGAASLYFEPGELADVGQLPVSTVGWLAYSAVGASVVGHAGMSWLLQRHPVSVIAPLTLPTPLISVGFGVILLGTPLTPQMIAGGAVALVGVTIITLRTARARVREEGGMIDCPSPNHDDRGGVPVSMIVLHYTGMESADAALQRLTDAEAKVSAHYMVAEDGTVMRLVDEGRRAWHAGKSYWRGITNVNAASVGIEIVNPGHEWGYKPFAGPQMGAVLRLTAEIVRRHGIKPAMVVGHSDVAPTRKEDPGELFDWDLLARNGLAYGPVKPIADPHWTDGGTLLALNRFGYDVADGPAALRAFQRRFRPDRIDGIIDGETRAILLTLLINEERAANQPAD